MKRLLYAIRMWLIDILGGVPKPQYDYLHGLLYRSREDFKALCRGTNKEINNYRIVVREICRRSDNAYYDWCCEYCDNARECGKPNGWCDGFVPMHYNYGK